MHEAVFTFHTPAAPLLYRALAPEAGEVAGSRSHEEVALAGPDSLVLMVRAADVHALRAALNMWLRLVNVADEIQEMIRHE
ncbi:MAG: KEOPS complex subunit Pcc1 [Methanofollis sp.]|jgi:KEOPS complex subunit Pcc1|uniref:KEOPS complex subunit Pcc1 n=1 Tax=unclassified Methanofollis TaxID=2634179 RepID=UPI00262ECA22|nr:KEOPS complex subunit Pcc1 [Methanofollis sp.]MDD4255025.1 KEOPS complex subunit Pcc1 [Methanofollis sp.]